ncbi:MAG: cellulose synthase/poly-beta-1,6-N-acetylglucosamine synthase-like glycosyltransferase [Candidatus Marivariicella framensis]|jgi:cellulose synthase/poly-beta-1,6-N-acetylglucosamine synthase-like glycosyltransferase|tara:strand:- start:2268 stop:3779 length:1512 start_codon:yes stop_codon:yes gene_type:complete
MIEIQYQILLIIVITLIFIYSTSLIVIFLYAIAQFNLLINYMSEKSKSKKLIQWDFNKRDEIPFVTIQLPIYNELYVIERLLNAVEKIKYPHDKLEIQVLDDSDDDSVELTKKLIHKIKNTGIDIVHLKRKNRFGFKAGALKEGLKKSKGEYVAIFDSDFVPNPNFLIKTVPYFKNIKVGMVQTRWGHINRDFSILTKVQAFGLDGHFTLEQVGRNYKNHFINFNGTAGVWRKSTIIDAGNWECDTITEDLDLSYRAQLKDWKFIYLEKIITPAELPVVISAVRSQQYRWNKGGAENFRKNIYNVLKSNKLSFKTKFHATFHLLNSTMFLNIFLIGFLSVPMLYIKNEWIELAWYFNISSLFILSTLMFYVCYWFLHKQKYGSGIASIFDYTLRFLAFYSITIAFSAHNSIAVIKGHLGIKSPFIRTPKFNLDNKKTLIQNRYLEKSINKYTIIEALMSLYFLFGLYSAFNVGENGDFGLFPFHLLLFLGFGFITIKSFIEIK